MILAGRQIVFRRASLGQLIILRRSAERMIKLAESADGDGSTVLAAVVKTLDFVETLIVSEDDRQFVEDQMLAGNVDYLDLFKALGGGGDDQADDQAPKPVKRAPRKSPKAAPVAKKVTPRGRPKR